jgi:hypothetical protein
MLAADAELGCNVKTADSDSSSSSESEEDADMESLDDEQRQNKLVAKQKRRLEKKEARSKEKQTMFEAFAATVEHAFRHPSDQGVEFPQLIKPFQSLIEQYSELKKVDVAPMQLNELFQQQAETMPGTAEATSSGSTSQGPSGAVPSNESQDAEMPATATPVAAAKPKAAPSSVNKKREPEEPSSAGSGEALAKQPCLEEPATQDGAVANQENVPSVLSALDQTPRPSTIFSLCRCT